MWGEIIVANRGIERQLTNDNNRHWHNKLCEFYFNFHDVRGWREMDKKNLSIEKWWNSISHKLGLGTKKKEENLKRD